jgi:hypothetical protein
MERQRYSVRRVNALPDCRIGAEMFMISTLHRKPGIPATVVDLAMDNDWSATRAWREHLELTQDEISKRMGITQGAYAQLEVKKKYGNPAVRKSPPRSASTNRNWIFDRPGAVKPEPTPSCAKPCLKPLRAEVVIVGFLLFSLDSGLRRNDDVSLCAPC